MCRCEEYIRGIKVSCREVQFVPQSSQRESARDSQNSIEQQAA
jgi:hypothetical protein